MHIGMIAINLHGGVENTSQSVRQTGNFIVQPVAVCEDNVVDVPNEILVPPDSVLEASRSRFFLALNEKSDVGLKFFFMNKINHTIQSGHDGSLVV